jgi:hypothetical protein
MANKVILINVWAAEIEDEPGAAADKLGTLARAGADLQFVLARRQPDNPGRGILFVAPLKGKKTEEAAQMAGFAPSADLIGVRVEGDNKAGLGHRLTNAVAQAGFNLRGLSAQVIGKKFVAFFAFDNETDARGCLGVLRKVK